MKLEEMGGLTPQEVRQVIRRGEYDGPTAGLCMGYAQCNLVVLPKEHAYDFLLFAQRNSRACPVLEVSEVGSRSLSFLAQDVDIARDFPWYRLYRNGELAGEYTQVEELWRDDLVSFLIGCSFSFEAALLEAGVPVRHIEQGRNVPMYRTNILCHSAGVFHGNMVVSMRPMPPSQVVRGPSPQPCPGSTVRRFTSVLRRRSALQIWPDLIMARRWTSPQGKCRCSGPAASPLRMF